MKTLLVGPPLSSSFYPPLGLPSLAAAVRASGRHDCRIADLSIDVLSEVTRPEYLAELAQRVEARYASLAERGSLAGREQAEYHRVANALLSSKATVDGIPSALAVLRDAERLADREERARAVRTFERLFELIGADNPEFHLTHSDVQWGAAPFSLDATREFVRGARSPFADALERRLDELIAEEKPAVLGVSINYYGQLLCGLELLRHARAAHPDVITVVGGSLMPEVAESLATDPTLSALVDHVICYEGETALVSLLDALEAGGPGATADVLNRVDPVDGAVRNRHREQVADLPVPDFDDLPLARYLSPRPVLPLLTSRGCYWGDCAFCTHFHTYGDDYRPSRTAQIVDAMAALSERHDTDAFYFVDESLAPSAARAISAELSARSLDLVWGTELRMEAALTDATLAEMHAAGCRVLSFGLESGSQRTLDLMDKGIDTADVHRILRTCASVGIAAHAMCIVGFPGEAREDVDVTFQLLRDHRDDLALVGFSPFTLNKNSVVHRDPERFGVEVQGDADPLRPDVDYTVRAGVRPDEAIALCASIEESELMRRITERASIATREHLLFVRVQAGPTRLGPEADPETDPEPRRYRSRPDDVHERRLAFPIGAVLPGDEWERAERIALIRGAPLPPEPAPVAPEERRYVHVGSSGRTLEASEGLLAILRACGQPAEPSELALRLAGGDSQAAAESKERLGHVLEALAELELVEVVA